MNTIETTQLFTGIAVGHPVTHRYYIGMSLEARPDLGPLDRAIEIFDGSSAPTSALLYFRNGREPIDSRELAPNTSHTAFFLPAVRLATSETAPHPIAYPAATDNESPYGFTHGEALRISQDILRTLYARPPVLQSPYCLIERPTGIQIERATLANRNDWYEPKNGDAFPSYRAAVIAFLRATNVTIIEPANIPT